MILTQEVNRGNLLRIVNILSPILKFSTNDAVIQNVSYVKRKDEKGLMGMSASQARLLSITARLTDNENSGQSISYAKIRLANQTEQANTDYLNALKATKLTVLTGFNGSEEVYSDISYGLMTGYNTVAAGTQYIVTDKKGKVLVTAKQAEAFKQGNGNFNTFLAALGYSQSDVGIKANSTTATDTEKAEAYQKVHEAWDQYLTSVGLHIGEDEEHGLDFGFQSFSSSPFDGYPTYTVTDLTTGEKTTKALNYEGTTQEQRDMYDYATAITESYYGATTSSTLNTAENADNTGYINYLKNIFQKMASAGFYTEDDEKTTLKDNTWFEKGLREGNLQLKYYSAVDKKFVSTSIDSDSAIQEVNDEREIAIVEQEYQMKLDDLEQKDNKYDLELKKLDTEHSALQTEYDAIKNVIDKNVESSFKCFS